jgi:hypothetical protein
MTTQLPTLVALTSKMSSGEISPSELAQVAGALQRQANEELRRAWTHAQTTIVACPDPRQIPHGYAPIIVQGELDEPGAAGYHTDENGQPYALVQYDPEPDSGWTLTCSHEYVEMALDPLGSTLYRAPSPDPSVRHGRGHKSHVVQVLLELGDPVEAAEYAYKIDGVTVSDFILHPYGNGSKGEKFDHLGALRGPRTIMPGGYVSWVEPDGEWRQLTWFGGDGPTVNVLGRRTAEHRGESLREWVDARTAPH